MSQFSGIEYLGRQKSLQRQIEIDLTGHLFHACFELTKIGIIHVRVDGYLTITA